MMNRFQTFAFNFNLRRYTGALCDKVTIFGFLRTW